LRINQYGRQQAYDKKHFKRIKEANQASRREAGLAGSDQTLSERRRNGPLYEELGTWRAPMMLAKLEMIIICPGMKWAPQQPMTRHISHNRTTASLSLRLIFVINHASLFFFSTNGMVVVGDTLNVI
jgi:hypothetical protein